MALPQMLVTDRWPPEPPRGWGGIPAALGPLCRHSATWRFPAPRSIWLLASATAALAILLTPTSSQAIPGALGPALAPQCDPQTFGGVTHCLDDGGNTHIVVVQLNHPSVRLRTTLSSRSGVECNSVNHRNKDGGSNCAAPYPFERVDSILARYAGSGAVAAINTDYFGRDGDHGAEGLTIRDGDRLDGPNHADTDGNATVRSFLSISTSKTAVIRKLTSENQRDQLGYLLDDPG